MRVLIQRVTEAQVTVAGSTVGAINHGLLLLVGIEQDDDLQRVTRMAERVLSYRLFADDDGKMNLSVGAVNGGVLAVSQFTLVADTNKGLRPSFSRAAAPDRARELYLQFVEQLGARHQPVASGIFAADMQVQLVNDGPVTFLLEL